MGIYVCEEDVVGTPKGITLTKNFRRETVDGDETVAQISRFLEFYLINLGVSKVKHFVPSDGMSVRSSSGLAFVVPPDVESLDSEQQLCDASASGQVNEVSTSCRKDRGSGWRDLL